MHFFPCHLVVFSRKFVEMAPVAIAGALIAIYCLLFLWKYFILKQRSKGAASSHGAPLLGMYLMLIFYAYIYLTKTALDVFNCNSTTPPDGRTYLEVVFVPCGEPGGLQLHLLPLAIIAFMVYSVGFPTMLLYTLAKNRALIMEDQVCAGCILASVGWSHVCCCCSSSASAAAAATVVVVVVVVVCSVAAVEPWGLAFSCNS